MRLLSVDFDFFFPTNEREQMWLWDWGHREAPFFIEAIWTSRAAAFLRAGVPLPGLSNDIDAFWDRMQIGKGATLYVSESHADAADHRVRRGVSSVVSYDAHHDCGYSRQAVAEMKLTRKIDCAVWLAFYALTGAERTVA